MKKINLLSARIGSPIILLLSAAIIFSNCNENENKVEFEKYQEEPAPILSTSEKNKIKEFEESYLSGHSKVTRSNVYQDCKEESIKLFGYSTIVYHGKDSIFVNKLWNLYKKEIDKNGSFLVLDGKVRVYYPLCNAIITVNGKKYMADENGIVKITNLTRSVMSRLKLYGRQKTKLSHYSRFIYQRKPYTVYANMKSVIYDLGVKNLCCKHNKQQSASISYTLSENTNSIIDNDTTEIEDTNEVITYPDGEDSIESTPISCYKNHGNSNCTTAFGVSQGRCPFKSDECMDYNGFGTDCSGSKLYFVGSDCSVAMSSGHCWNEVM